jgi:hypothetical protein
MKAFTVREIFKIARFTDASCICTYNIMHTEELHVTSVFHQIYKIQNRLCWKSTFYSFVHRMLRNIRSPDTAAESYGL